MQRVNEAIKNGTTVYSANKFASIIGLNPSTFRSLLQRSAVKNPLVELGNGIEAKRLDKSWEVYVPAPVSSDNLEEARFFPKLLSGMKLVAKADDPAA